MILSFDTSSELSSVALTNGSAIVAQRLALDARRHAEVLAPLLRAVLDESGVRAADVSAIACGVGPGPYTGLRVGIATARAIGLAWDRPVVGVCSLDAVAAAALAGTDAGEIGVASDARRREVYWARYSRDRARVLGPFVGPAMSIDVSLRDGRWAGHGAAAYADAFGSVVAATPDDSDLLYPHAAWIGRLAGRLLAASEPVSMAQPRLAGQGSDGEATARALQGARLLPPEPLYLRRPDAVEPVRRAAR